MPQRLPERTLQEERKQRRLKEGIYRFLPFQDPPIKEGEEIQVLINDRKIAIAED